MQRGKRRKKYNPCIPHYPNLIEFFLGLERGWVGASQFVIIQRSQNIYISGVMFPRNGQGVQNSVRVTHLYLLILLDPLIGLLVSLKSLFYYYYKGK